VVKTSNKIIYLIFNILSIYTIILSAIIIPKETEPDRKNSAFGFGIGFYGSTLLITMYGGEKIAE
jgi:hypothetical protein